MKTLQQMPLIKYSHYLKYIGLIISILTISLIFVVFLTKPTLEKEHIETNRQRQLKQMIHAEPKLKKQLSLSQVQSNKIEHFISSHGWNQFNLLSVFITLVQQSGLSIKQLTPEATTASITLKATGQYIELIKFLYRLIQSHSNIYLDRLKINSNGGTLNILIHAKAYFILMPI
jgi:hypothetical protein